MLMKNIIKTWNAILSFLLLILSVGIVVFYFVSDRADTPILIIGVALFAIAGAFGINASISWYAQYKMNKPFEMETNILHIYAQYNETNPVYIIGNEFALKTLRKSIDYAIETGSRSTGKCYKVNDDERFEVRVICPEDSEEVMCSLSSPYIRKKANASKDLQKIIFPDELWNTFNG